MDAQKFLKFFKVSKDALDELCSENHVQHLYFFGSFSSDKFLKTSDVDFLVEFETPNFDNYFGLLEGLRNLFKDYNVDLISVGALKNKIIQDEVNKSKQELYAA